MSDDWRLRIELGEEGARGLLGRLGILDTDADQPTKVAGVLGTQTRIAFRTDCRHDLEAAVSLGLDCA